MRRVSVCVWCRSARAQALCQPNMVGTCCRGRATTTGGAWPMRNESTTPQLGCCLRRPLAAHVYFACWLAACSWRAAGARARAGTTTGNSTIRELTDTGRIPGNVMVGWSKMNSCFSSYHGSFPWTTPDRPTAVKPAPWYNGMMGCLAMSRHSSTCGTFSWTCRQVRLHHPRGHALAPGAAQ